MCQCNCGRDRDLVIMGQLAEIRLLISNIPTTTQLEEFVATVTERLDAVLANVSDTNAALERARTEIVAAIGRQDEVIRDLRTAVENGTVTEAQISELELRSGETRRAAGALDDLNVDVPPPAETDPEPAPVEPTPAPEEGGETPSVAQGGFGL